LATDLHADATDQYFDGYPEIHHFLSVLPSGVFLVGDLTEVLNINIHQARAVCVRLEQYGVIERDTHGRRFITIAGYRAIVRKLRKDR
jgi:hypothetical protein